MKRLLYLTLFSAVWIGFSVPAMAQWPIHGWRPRPDIGEGRWPVPNLNGTWFMNGHESAQCQVFQGRWDGRAQFFNEHGSRAWGTIRGDEVWVPDWNDGFGNIGLRGRIRGDRIIWPDGSFWSRTPREP